MKKQGKNKIKIIAIILVIFIFIYIVPSIMINKKLTNIKKNIVLGNNIEKRTIYSINQQVHLAKLINRNERYDISIEDNVIYNDKLPIKINILDKTMNLKSLNLEINESKMSINNYSSIVEYEIKNEGKNLVNLKLLYDNEKIYESNYDIYYIIPYKEQFAEKITHNGICTHFAKMGTDSISDSNLKLLKSIGVKLVRDDIYGPSLYKNGKFLSSETDMWIKKLLENDIDLIPIFGATGKKSTDIDNQTMEETIDMIKQFQNNYPSIKNYELFNEPNFRYTTDEQIKWFTKIEYEVNSEMQKTDSKIKILGDGIAYGNTNFFNEYFDKMNKLNDNYYRISNYSLHKYDWDRDNGLNTNYKWAIGKVNTKLNEYGGFYQKSITECGLNTTTSSNIQQANQDVQQLVINNSNNYYISMIYNFRDRGTDPSNIEHNFGIVDYNWQPKEAYYSLKKYYENTNGGEYIGKINIANGIEAYLFDKDGKTKIIAWTITDGNTINIDYSGFTAKDMYGNDIENTNGKLEISNSPVYLDNVSTNYFYQAISNSITNGYSEFNTKFADEISKVDGITAEINNLNNQAISLKNASTFDENKANELMKEHFELGNMIMSAYENGKLNIEYVKLSSMLDYLNTIGNSYEDLVTVSAKTRITDLSDITNEVNTAKSLAQDNEKFDIVYPNKIYKFAQDLLDTSSYVLGLEEENDIKTGLINSKALHARYLAEWSQEFSKIYMKDALKTSTNSFIEKNETIKNNNKVIYENPNVKRSYDKLKNSINTLIENPETNNVDVVYLNQINIAKTIMNEVIAKTINIQRDDYKKTICNILNISDDYRSLYNYYIKSDGIDRTQIKNNINKIINRYNDNLDISILSSETEMIKQVKDLYDNSIETDKNSDNYLNKQRILQTCDIISQMLENDIKQHADKEFTQITKSSNHDLNKYTNQDEIITINLPNDKAKIADNNGENSITFSKNDSKTIKINIRGYEYDYKVEVTNIDKSYPTLNVQKEGTSITPNATDNNLDKITIMKDGKEIKYNIGSQITEPGIYEIIATDKAGNKVNTKSIVYGTFTNEQNVKEKYVPVFPGQKTQSIIENSEYSIANDKQQKLGDDFVATGDKLKSQNDTYIVIVKGDITGAGKADIMSLIQLRKNIVGLKDFTKIQQLASDINSDGRTNSIDLVSERKLIVGKE